MQTTFQLTKEDWRALSRVIGRRRWWFWSGLLAFVGFIVISDLFDRYMFMLYPNLHEVTLFYQMRHVAIGVVGWSLLWAIINYFTWSKAKRAPMFNAPSVVRVDGNGFSRTTLENSKAIVWSDVYNLVETSTHFFVLTDAKNRVHHSQTQLCIGSGSRAIYRLRAHASRKRANRQAAACPTLIMKKVDRWRPRLAQLPISRF